MLRTHVRQTCGCQQPEQMAWGKYRVSDKSLSLIPPKTVLKEELQGETERTERLFTVTKAHATRAGVCHLD